MTVEFIFQIAILIMSVVVHEVAHGYTANLLGDPTAKYEGRLTLNPLKHLDPIGSFFVPLISFFLGGFIFGWAKPVPYNPHNLRPGRFSEAWVAAAGPITNISLAVIFAMIMRAGISGALPVGEGFLHISAMIVFVNLLLALFNLIPIPPLDGSKLLFAAFPEKIHQFRAFFERFGILLLILFIFFLWEFISPVVFALFKLLVGVPLAF